MNKFQQIMAQKNLLAIAKAVAKRPIPLPEKVDLLNQKKAAKIQARDNFRRMKASKDAFKIRSFEKQKVRDALRQNY